MAGLRLIAVAAVLGVAFLGAVGWAVLSAPPGAPRVERHLACAFDAPLAGPAGAVAVPATFGIVFNGAHHRTYLEMEGWPRTASALPPDADGIRLVHSRADDRPNIGIALRPDGGFEAAVLAEGGLAFTALRASGTCQATDVEIRT
jgi:hypothetical protein